MSYSHKLSQVTHSGPALCVGLDPHPEVLSAWGLSEEAGGLADFVTLSVAALREAGAVVAKPQVALFERHGVAGMSALAALCAQLREAGVIVIGDAKRGDIGSTMEGYARGWLRRGADFEVDALTVNPYLGVGALIPAFEAARDSEKGVFVLAATSNPEARPLQGSLDADGLSVAGRIVREVSQWEAEHAPSAPGTLGVVVGATVDQGALGLHLEATPALPILAPGYGAQGAVLAEARRHFPHSLSVIAVAGRSVLLGPASEFAARISDAAEELTR